MMAPTWGNSSPAIYKWLFIMGAVMTNIMWSCFMVAIFACATANPRSYYNPRNLPSFQYRQYRGWHAGVVSGDKPFHEDFTPKEPPSFWHPRSHGRGNRRYGYPRSQWWNHRPTEPPSWDQRPYAGGPPPKPTDEWQPQATTQPPLRTPPERRGPPPERLTQVDAECRGLVSSFDVTDSVAGIFEQEGDMCRAALRACQFERSAYSLCCSGGAIQAPFMEVDVHLGGHNTPCDSVNIRCPPSC